MRTFVLIFVVLIIAGFAGYYFLYPSENHTSPINILHAHHHGDKLDSLNGVYVFYNDHNKSETKRNIASNGYNIGLEYECVEFVKRYYFEHYDHEMPNSYGNAIDFYHVGLKDGGFNKDRSLIQYTNPSTKKPASGDIIVFDATTSNAYGHVAIIAETGDEYIEIIQQNAGIQSKTRDRIALSHENEKWKIESSRVLGRLRKE